MRYIIEHLKSLDWLLLGAVAIIFLLGLLTLFAAPGEVTNFYKQSVFGIISLGLILTISFFDYRIFRERPALLIGLYLFGLALLFLLFIVGSNIRGVTAWFLIGGLAIQPVELVKVILLLVLAKYLSRWHIELYKFRHLFISGLYAFIPTVMVLAQPDFGSALVLLASWVGLVIISGIKAKQVMLIVFTGLVALTLFWGFGLQDYQKARVLNFVNPRADPLGGAYQTRQSIIALGSGGLFGKGLGEGSQIRLGFLPEYQSDFIFSAISEEWGFIGSTIIILLWIVIFWRLYVTWIRVDNNFAKLFVGGVFILFLTHVAINLGTSLGLLPVTGIPLPFVSYGGSNMLSFSLALGLVSSIRAYSISHPKEQG